MPSKELDLETFADGFLSLRRESRTGTYRVVCADDREVYLLLKDGFITDVDTREELSLLTSAIIHSAKLSERDLKRARKAQAKSDTPLGAVLLSQVEVPEEDLLSAVRSRIADAICALFTTRVKEASFIDHSADERLEGFASELSDVLEVQADPEELYVEAASRLERWDLIERGCSLLTDVCYATPDAFRYFQEEDKYPNEVAIIGMIDGKNDIAEVVEQAVERLSGEIDPFKAFTILRSLVERGEVQFINPVQLFQLGVECQAEGRHDKALKLFTRASQRGLDDFDLCLKIAKTMEALGRRPEAAVKYQEFAEKCLAQFRPDDAIKCYRRAGELEPRNIPWGQKLLELLLKENRRDEALAHGLQLAGRYAAGGDARGGLDVLQDLRRKGFKEEKLGQKIIELAEQLGDEGAISSERRRLANEFVAKKDVEKALQMYQQLFCEGNGSPEVRLKLVDLHLEKGNHKLVLEHIGALLSMSEGERIKDLAVLRRLHELVCQLRPGDPRSNRWLVEYHLRTQNRDQALTVLRNLAAHLERAGDPRDAVRVLRQLITVDGDSLENRWRLAKSYEKMGKAGEQIKELHGIASMALKQKDLKEAERAFKEVLKASPFDVGARRELGNLCEGQGDAARARACFKEVAFLNALAGNFKEAQEYCDRVLTISPSDPEVIHRLGEICEAQGDADKAVQEILKAATIHLEQKNLGFVREVLAGALKLKPSHPEALELLRSLEEQEAVLSGKRSAPALSFPATPVSRPGREKVEPFQVSGPVIKKSVAGITAKLKGLKSSGSSPATVQAPPPAGGGAEEPASFGEKAPPGGLRTKAGGIVNAASRLKALAGGAKPAPNAPPGDAAAPERAAAPTEGGLEGKAPAGTQSADSSETTPIFDVQEVERIRLAIQNASERVESAHKDEGSGGSAESDGGAEPPKKKALGKSAALLAKLRQGESKKQAEETEAKTELEKEPG